MAKLPSAAPLNAGKIRAQLNLLDEACRRVLSGMFGKNKPADRILSDYFREHRCCGSRDRALISETVFSLLRYWGFLRRCLPDARRGAIEAGNISLTKVELGALLSAASFIGNEENNASLLQGNCQLPPLPRAAETPQKRARQMADYFAVPVEMELQHLIPDWVAAKLPAEMDRELFLSALSHRPPIWLRLQCPAPQEEPEVLEELRAAGADVQVSSLLPGALCVRAKINLRTLESFRQGKFELQDLASQCVGAACGAKAGERWFDACAGAGGKTLQLAQMMHRKGSVTAGDLRAYKLDDLRKRARRAGFPNILVKESLSGKAKHPFDGVLVDAPCSCSGVWRRNPGAAWKLQEKEVAELAGTQKKILTSYAASVRPGGVLVYATCSLFDEENGAVVRDFLADNPGFKLDPFLHPITNQLVPGMIRIDGGSYDCDTLFVAKMRRMP